MLPDATGGANWQGGSLDPETNILYIFANTAACTVARHSMQAATSDAQSDMRLTCRGTRRRDPNAAAAAAVLVAAAVAAAVKVAAD